MNSETPPTTLVPLTPEEINDLARRVVTNEVFLTNTSEGYRNAFGGFLMLAGEAIAPFADEVGAMYAPWSEAGSRSVNGFPTFFGASFVHKDSLAALLEAIEAKQKALSDA